MNRTRLLLIGGAVAVVAVAIFATTASRREPTATPAPTPDIRHYLLNVDQALSTFDGATAETTGSLRLRVAPGEGEVEALSLAIEPIDTARGSTGPISLSLGTGSSTITRSGGTISGSFPVRFWYPLMYQIAGEQVTDDVVRPQHEHTGTAAFEGRFTDSDSQWQATITLTPDPVETTDFNLPQGRIEMQTPVVYETDDQFSRNAGGGTRVWCVDVVNDANAFPEQEAQDAIREMRQIVRNLGGAVLTAGEIAELNTAILGVQPGQSETRDPARLPVKKCYSVRLVRTHAPGGGATSDIARRTITVGMNYRTACGATSLGRMIAHQLGHAFLLQLQNETARGEDNLMRACAPGESLDDEQRRGYWSYVSELPDEVTIPGRGSLQNVSATQLGALLDRLVSGAALPTIEASPSPTTSPTATRRPTATPRRTPAPRPATPTPVPTATPAPTAAPTATPTAVPTASPTAAPTPTPTGSPEP